MKHLKRLFVIAVITIGTAIPVGALGAQPAYADLGNPWDGCAQSGYITVASQYSGDGTIYLEFSPMCNTAWETWQGCNISSVYVQNRLGDRGYAIVGGCAGYTAQVDDGGNDQAQAVAYGAGTGWFWTAWW